MKVFSRSLPKHIAPLIRACFLAAITSQFLIATAQPAASEETPPSDPTVAGLVAAYSFDEGMGLMVTDASGNGNNGVISGAAWTSQGHFGNALSFTAPNWVTVNDSNSLDLTSGMTLEAWIFPTAAPVTWTTVIFKEYPEVNNQVYGLYGGSPSTLPLVDVFTNSIQEQYGFSALPINAWTFLAATYDAVGGLTLFVNSAQVGHLPGSGNMVTSLGALRIGGNSIFGEHFMGVIDNVRIYNRALNQTEIQTDMELPIGGGGPTPTPGPSATPPPPTPAPTATPAPTPGSCTLKSEYWQSHPSAWCLANIQLGCVTYTRSEAVAIIRHSSSHDKTYSLAKQLIAAKLNIACKNTNSTCINSAIAAANAWLCTYPIGSDVLANSPAWRAINTTNTALEKYNSGQLCAPGCIVAQ